MALKIDFKKNVFLTRAIKTDLQYLENHIQFLINSVSQFIPFPLLALATNDVVWALGVFSIPEQVMGPHIHLGELGKL